jgi:alpha-ketoglutarate-dependent taurine dioxygenase
MTTLAPHTTHFELRQVTSNIGAEVHGIDLSEELDGDTVAALRLALNRHRALVFSDVHLEDAGQQRFVHSFGPLTSAHPTVPSLDGALHVLPVDSERGKSNHWHTDVTFVVNPPQLSSLRSLVVPSYGGETLIADSGVRTVPYRHRSPASPTRCGPCTATCMTTRCRNLLTKRRQSVARCSPRPNTRACTQSYGCIH